MIYDGGNAVVFDQEAFQRKLGALPKGGSPGDTLLRDAGDQFQTHWGPAGSGSTPDAVIIDIVATVNIAAFNVVTSLGKVADSSNVSQGFGKVVGVANAAIPNGFSGEVVQTGEVTNPAWTWTIGDAVYLNGTSLSTSAPATGFSQRIGTAVAPTILVVELSEPVML